MVLFFLCALSEQKIILFLAFLDFFAFKKELITIIFMATKLEGVYLEGQSMLW